MKRSDELTGVQEGERLERTSGGDAVREEDAGRRIRPVIDEAYPPPRDKRPASKSDRVARMGTGSIPRLVLEFAIPSIVGMLVNGAYNIIDSIFLGQAMGELGLSTVTAATPTMVVFMALAMLVGMGGNALAALRLGAGKRDGAELCLGNTVFLSLVLWALVVAVAFVPPLVEGLLTLSSATDEVRPYARVFVQILSIGFVFQCVGMGVNNFIRTSGAPNRALVTMLVGTGSCIAFSFLFVMVLGWGVQGSALATILGQAVSCATVIWYFTKTKSAPLRLRRRYLRPHASTVRKILALGLASFAVQAAAAVVNVVVNYVLVTYGSQSPIGARDALASIGVVQRIAMFAVLPVIGVSVAVQPLLGYNYGAKLVGRVRSALWQGVLLATVIATVFWSMTHLFPHQIVELFGITNDELRDFTVFALQVQLLMLPLCGFQIVGSSYFQATGQPLKSTVLTLSRQVIFLAPLLLVLPAVMPSMGAQFTSLDAVYFATPVADILAIVVTAIMVFREMGRLRSLESDLESGIARGA